MADNPAPQRVVTDIQEGVKSFTFKTSYDWTSVFPTPRKKLHYREHVTSDPCSLGPPRKRSGKFPHAKSSNLPALELTLPDLSGIRPPSPVKMIESTSTATQPKIALSPPTVPTSLPKAMPASSATMEPASHPPGRAARRRPRFRQLDYASVVISPPSVDLFTVLFRPSGEHSLHNCNQRLLYNELSVIAVPSAIRDLRGGGIAADFSPSSPRDLLLGLSSLQGIPVKPSLPSSPSFLAGVIKHLHPDITEEEFLAEVSSPSPIKSIKRLAKPGSTTWVVKALFEGPTIPDHVYFAGRRLRVLPFVPRPLQCRKCHKFNHVAKHCRTGTCCSRCGGPHDISSCPKLSPKCLNCGGGHPATDPSCPAFDFQKKVSEVRATNGLSAFAAKQAVKKAATSYASVLRQNAPRPEPARNHIFSRDPSPSRIASLVADVTAAVMAACRNNDLSGLINVILGLLQDRTGIKLPNATFESLLANRTPLPDCESSD